MNRKRTNRPKLSCEAVEPRLLLTSFGFMQHTVYETLEKPNTALADLDGDANRGTRQFSESFVAGSSTRSICRAIAR